MGCTFVDYIIVSFGVNAEMRSEIDLSYLGKLPVIGFAVPLHALPFNGNGVNCVADSRRGIYRGPTLRPAIAVYILLLTIVTSLQQTPRLCEI